MPDQRITQLAADASPSSDDLIVTVHDPTGTPANRKVTLSDFMTFVFQQLPKTGDDTDIVTGTAGADGQIAVFNADGDLIGATGTDVTSFNGVLGFDGAGNAVEIDTKAELEARISDLDYATAAEARQAEVEEQTATSYSLLAADNGKTKRHNNAAAQTVTIPSNATLALAVGHTSNHFQYGAGAVTITAASGVTLNGVSAGSGDIQTQYSGLVTLVKIATNEWIAFGDIATVA